MLAFIFVYSVHNVTMTNTSFLTWMTMLFTFLLTFKGYLDQFSRALHLEYSDRGIFVQSLTPFQVYFQKAIPNPHYK